MLLITTVNWVGYHRKSKMRPDEWIWRDRLNPAPVLTRMVPPLLAMYWLGNNRAINLTNEEASQALASLGQIVINLAVSPAFVHVEPWLENLEPRQYTISMFVYLLVRHMGLHQFFWSWLRNSQPMLGKRSTRHVKRDMF